MKLEMHLHWIRELYFKHSPNLILFDNAQRMNKTLDLTLELISKANRSVRYAQHLCLPFNALFHFLPCLFKLEINCAPSIISTPMKPMQTTTQ